MSRFICLTVIRAVRIEMWVLLSDVAWLVAEYEPGWSG